MMTKLPINFLFLFPNTKHNTSMVYTFIFALVPKIKCFIPELRKIYYYSDGCAGQYKKDLILCICVITKWILIQSVNGTFFCNFTWKKCL